MPGVALWPSWGTDAAIFVIFNKSWPENVMEWLWSAKNPVTGHGGFALENLSLHCLETY
jgi:hypothetical protein